MHPWISVCIWWGTRDTIVHLQRPFHVPWMCFVPQWDAGERSRKPSYPLLSFMLRACPGSVFLLLQTCRRF
jgi:hypothetical protein